jgi:hypothetical protein
MCLGNKAPQATIWVNEQVKVLWGLSKTCVDHYCLGFKSPITEVVLSTALAQLCVGRHPNPSNPSKNDLDFYATFGAPELEFICNHDVIITFKLESGSFKSRKSDESLPKIFENYHCAFRVPFKQHLIVDRDHPVSSHTSACKAKFIILDLKNAKFIHDFSGFKGAVKPSYDDANQTQEKIIHFLNNDYLPLLIRAGFHFIQSLPDFDSLSSTHLIDWSAIAGDKTEIFKVCGINVGMINAYLRGRWLEAAWHCEEIKGRDDKTGLELCALAEREVTIGKFVFQVAFAPPQVRALCAKEVILYFDLPEIQIHDSRSKNTIKWSKWKIAIVAEVILEETEGGMVQRLKADFTSARFCENLSSLGNKDDKDATFLECRSLLIEYITTRYLSLLAECGSHYIYYIDLRCIDEESPIQVLEEDPTDHVCITDTYGFDFVAAVTQASVNQHLYYLFDKVTILKHYLDGDLDCHFACPRIQFLKSPPNTVILSLTLEKGWLKCKGSQHNFANWQIAFQMGLKFEKYNKADHSDVYFGAHGKYAGDKHRLVLDVEHAKFLPNWSHFPGLLDEVDFYAMRSKYIHLVIHMKEYLRRWLKGEDQYNPHVLYILPSQETHHTWKQPRFTLNSPEYRLTDVPRKVNATSPGLANVVNCGVIVICATIDNLLHPSFPKSPDWTWKYNDEPFHGTIVLSRETFLNRWISNNLDEINSYTTLIPKLNGVATVDDWRFSLVTLKEALENKNGQFGWIAGRKYKWVDHGCDANKLTFRHDSDDVWSYRHVGELGGTHNGTCTISCKTENTMEIPIVLDKDGCKVRIKGLISLELTFSGQKKWKTEAQANWSWTISFLRGKSGQCLDVDVRKDRTIITGQPGFTGDYPGVQHAFKDAHTLLKREMEEMEQAMKKHLDPDTLEKSLKNRFIGNWYLLHSGTHPYTLRSPVFNSRGDFVLGLQPEYVSTASGKRSEHTNATVAVKHEQAPPQIEVPNKKHSTHGNGPVVEKAPTSPQVKPIVNDKAHASANGKPVAA